MCKDCPKRATCKKTCEAMENELSKVTAQTDHREILVDSEAMAYIWTHRTKLSLADLQGAVAAPPLDLVNSVLTPAQQEVIALHYRDHLTEQQIADHLGISHQAVHDRLAIARKRIRQLLARR